MDQPSQQKPRANLQDSARMISKAIIITGTTPITGPDARVPGAQQIQRRGCWHLWDLRFHCLVPLLVASSFPYTPESSSLIAPGVTLVGPSSVQCAVTTSLEPAGSKLWQCPCRATSAVIRVHVPKRHALLHPAFKEHSHLRPQKAQVPALKSFRDDPCRELPWVVVRQRDYVRPSC